LQPVSCYPPDLPFCSSCRSETNIPPLTPSPLCWFRSTSRASSRSSSSETLSRAVPVERGRHGVRSPATIGGS